MAVTLRGFLKHYRQGTLVDAVLARFGRLPPQIKVHYLGADSESEAAGALAKYARLFAMRSRTPGGWIASVGDNGPTHAGFNQRLSAWKVPFRSLSADALLALPEADSAALIGVVCAYPRARDIASLAERLLQHPRLSQVPFEYAPGLDRERNVFARLDEYPDTFFVSPVLRDPVDVYRIYEESLQRFEQKCGLRDFLDLYQMLLHVHRRGVPGDVVEFGSYRGHSGYLIAQVLKALGSSKKLYLFDTFEKFPRETYGVDGFWSDTHDVDFAEVRRKFEGVAGVEFVKGDLTQTLQTSGATSIALAYVDCDSYRATRYLIDEVYQRRLSPGGVMIFEDYGHPALLGNRLAVDEGLRAAGLGFQYFSQFSGLYIAAKY